MGSSAVACSSSSPRSGKVKVKRALQVVIAAGGVLVLISAIAAMEGMEPLRLQMVIDRLSKLMSTLSNLLKKASETAQGVTQNIK